MQDDNELRGNFLNRREWGSYLSALQTAANYPNMIEALKLTRDWFTQSAADASNWLVDSTTELRDTLVGSTTELRDTLVGSAAELRDKLSTG